MSHRGYLFVAKNKITVPCNIGGLSGMLAGSSRYHFVYFQCLNAIIVSLSPRVISITKIKVAANEYT